VRPLSSNPGTGEPLPQTCATPEGPGRGRHSVGVTARGRYVMRTPVLSTRLAPNSKWPPGPGAAVRSREISAGLPGGLWGRAGATVHAGGLAGRQVCRFLNAPQPVAEGALPSTPGAPASRGGAGDASRTACLRVTEGRRTRDPLRPHIAGGGPKPSRPGHQRHWRPRGHVPGTAFTDGSPSAGRRTPAVRAREVQPGYPSVAPPRCRGSRACLPQSPAPVEFANFRPGLIQRQIDESTKA
jgi:hypothetical protein